VSGKLLKRAQDAGAVRRDLTSEDVPVLMCAAAGTPPPLLDAYPDIWRRYAVVVLDGMRPGDTSKLEHAAPDLAAFDDALAAAAATSARPA
jgi:hypothetical protein